MTEKIYTRALKQLKEERAREQERLIKADERGIASVTQKEFEDAQVYGPGTGVAPRYKDDSINEIFNEMVFTAGIAQKVIEKAEEEGLELELSNQWKPIINSYRKHIAFWPASAIDLAEKKAERILEGYVSADKATRSKTKQGCTVIYNRITGFNDQGAPELEEICRTGLDLNHVPEPLKAVPGNVRLYVADLDQQPRIIGHDLDVTSRQAYKMQLNGSMEDYRRQMDELCSNEEVQDYIMKIVYTMTDND